MKNRPTNIDRQYGSTAVISAIVLIILGIIIFVAVQLFPLYWDHWNLEDSAKNALKLELVPPYDEVENKIRQTIIGLLDDMAAQYDEEHIQVVLTAETKRIRAEVWYSRNHHVPLYQNPKEFYLNVEQLAILSPIKEKLKNKLKRPTPLQ